MVSFSVKPLIIPPTLSKEYFELSIDVLTDMVFNSILDPLELEKEKQVVINEIQAIQDSPEELAYEYFLHNFWFNHPLSQNITGTVSQIKEITSDSPRINPVK